MVASKKMKHEATDLGPCLVEVSDEERVGIAGRASLELVALHLRNNNRSFAPPSVVAN